MIIELMVLIYKYFKNNIFKVSKINSITFQYHCFTYLFSWRYHTITWPEMSEDLLQNTNNTSPQRLLPHIFFRLCRGKHFSCACISPDIDHRCGKTMDADRRLARGNRQGPTTSAKWRWSHLRPTVLLKP